MRALVTGSVGIIGSHLTGRLLDQGQDVDGSPFLIDYQDSRIEMHRVADLQQHFTPIVQLDSSPAYLRAAR